MLGIIISAFQITGEIIPDHRRNTDWPMLGEAEEPRCAASCDKIPQLMSGQLFYSGAILDQRPVSKFRALNDNRWVINRQLTEERFDAVSARMLKREGK